MLWSFYYNCLIIRKNVDLILKYINCLTNFESWIIIFTYQNNIITLQF